MEKTVKVSVKHPESYRPRFPAIILLIEDFVESNPYGIYLDHLVNERYTIDDIEYEVIDCTKDGLIMAGVLDYADNLEGEADIGRLWDRVKHGTEDCVYKKIVDNMTPDYSVSVSIDYDKLGTSPLGFMFGNAAGTTEQPAGVDVYKIPSTYFVRVDSRHAEGREAWRLFGIIKDHFNGKYGWTCDDTLPAMEWYGPNGKSFVLVPIKQMEC